MNIEIAEISLLGYREENQDRIAVASNDDAALILAVDGMGGHADGARAAELAAEIVQKAFAGVGHPVFDPQGFMHRAIGQAHEALVELGNTLSVEARPRATCAMCLVQDGRAYWGHVGDSRIYHLRNGHVEERSRDHSHVEVLLQEGLIEESEIASHPMRNFVECCIGGYASLPRMSITNDKPISAGDMMLVCTDGFWSGLDEQTIAGLAVADGALTKNLKALGEMAVEACAPHSDNTSAVALRWQG